MRTFDPWDYSQNVDIEVSEAQHAILGKAMNLLSPLFTDSIPCYIHYFTDEVSGDDMCEEVCDSDECVFAYLKDKTGLIANRTADDGDHESINHCHICGCPLNTQLTWINQEFDYLEKEVTTLEEIQSNAFDIHCVLAAYPSADERINGYDRQQAKEGNIEPLNNKLLRQEAHVSRVIAYAELVINILSA